MAKKWTPSQKQLSIYDELLKRQNQARKAILRRRRIIEEEGMGRTLPDLIIPKKVRRYRDMTRYRFDSYKDYREKMRALQNLFGGKGSPDLQYYRMSYKQNIISVIRDWIDKYLNFQEKPKSKFGKYSEEQIYKANQIAEDGGKFLDLYNKYQSMSIAEFMAMYDTGHIPTLKIIYDEIRGVGDTMSPSYFSKVNEFIDNFSDWRRQSREDKNIMVKLFKDRPDIISSYKEDIKNRTEEKEESMRKDAKRIK